MFGLAGPQIVTLGLGIVVGVLLMQAGVALSASAVPMVVCLVLGLVRIGGRSLLEWVPSVWRWARTGGGKGQVWLAPLTRAASPWATTPPLPPPLDGQVILVAGEDRGAPVAVVHDQRGRHLRGQPQGGRAPVRPGGAGRAGEPAGHVGRRPGPVLPGAGPGGRGALERVGGAGGDGGTARLPGRAHDRRPPGPRRRLLPPAAAHQRTGGHPPRGPRHRGGLRGRIKAKVASAGDRQGGGHRGAGQRGRPAAGPPGAGRAGRLGAAHAP